MNTQQTITAIFDNIQQVSYEVAALASNIQEMAAHLHGDYETRNQNITEDEEQELENHLMTMLVDLEKAEKMMERHAKLIGADCM